MAIKKQNITKHKNVLPRIKMSKEVLTFRDIEIEKKKKNYCNKTPTFLKDVAIEQVLVSNKIYFGEKKLYFIDYLHDNHKVKSLRITLLKTSA